MFAASGGVATHQVRPLVAVHAHAVTQAVGKVFVIRTVAGVGDYLASGRVDAPHCAPGWAAAKAADCAR